MTLSFNMTMYLIKCRHDIVNTTNSTRAHLLVVIDANLIGYKDPAGVDAAKHVELFASIFSSNGVGVLVYADRSTLRFRPLYHYVVVQWSKCQQEHCSEDRFGSYLPPSKD